VVALPIPATVVATLALVAIGLAPPMSVLHLPGHRQSGAPMHAVAPVLVTVSSGLLANRGANSPVTVSGAGHQVVVRSGRSS
jgi:hypothetical protein